MPGQAGSRFRARTREGLRQLFPAVIAHIRVCRGWASAPSWPAGRRASVGGSERSSARMARSAREGRRIGGGAQKPIRLRWASRVLGIEHGFEAPDFAVVAEQDILGDRMVSPPQARGRRTFFPRPRAWRRAISGHIRARRRALCRSANHRRHGRAARLPGTAVRRRQAVPAGGEHRASDALRRGGRRARARPPRRRGLAAAQGAGSRVREIAGELIRIAAARELKSLPEFDPPEGAL